jgi:hypothetical protein
MLPETFNILKVCLTIREVAFNIVAGSRLRRQLNVAADEQHPLNIVERGVRSTNFQHVDSVNAV